jgi:hypothetical protein
MLHAGLLNGLFLDLKFEAADSTEALIKFQQKTRCSISEDIRNLRAYFLQYSNYSKLSHSEQYISSCKTVLSPEEATVYLY